MPEYRMCTFCVMDESDSKIEFDDAGRCNHCRSAAARLQKSWHTGPDGQKMLRESLEQIRRAGLGRPYDCVIGVSGGVDSSYLVCQAKNFGLRALLLHVDGGWNTREAEHNIAALAQYTGFDLERVTVAWEEMRDVQIAFLRAGVPNQDIPQDHAFFAALLDVCLARGIQYFLSGSNLATESILPASWGYDALDEFHISSIHRLFGQAPLRGFPLMPLERRLIYNGHSLGLEGRMNVFAPLNLTPYDPAKAKQFLTEQCGWRDYGRKHGESTFTKFFQNYYLPEKFGFDKRRAHLSSRIAAGSLMREEALAELANPLYEPDELAADKAFVLERLALTPAQWDELMAAPVRAHSDYPHAERLIRTVSKLYTREEHRLARRRDPLAYLAAKVKKFGRKLLG